MRISQALILALGVYCGRLVAEICPPDWQRYGESCYFIIKDKMDWYQANRTCAESRANLAIPNSKSKHDYMWELFLKEPDMTSTDHWIGCNDIEEEGNWQHCPLPGDINAYENWAEKEPNDNKGGEDCGAQVNKYNGQWDDRKCETLFFAICELPVCSGGRLNPQCLLHHAMEEFMGEGVGSCGKACRSHPRCHCFNLPKQAGGKMVCP
ncbi:lactose-binding lectin l-2-like [Asterias rubens]|uniref:lactose-binding lectin l-2-like n=1 Tax=Asterias rubens TaxID=7604 RepID=UPI0014559290|nr:lactose-binding lectin l-2-like [Asterias rubens]